MLNRERVGSWMAARVESGRNTLAGMIPSFTERLREPVKLVMERLGWLFDPETTHGKIALGVGLLTSFGLAFWGLTTDNIQLGLIAGAPVIALGAVAVGNTLGVIAEDIS